MFPQKFTYLCLHTLSISPHWYYITWHCAFLHQDENFFLTKLQIDSVGYLENVLHLLTFANNLTLQVPVPCFKRAYRQTGSTGIYVTLEQQIFMWYHWSDVANVCILPAGYSSSVGWISVVTFWVFWQWLYLWFNFAFDIFLYFLIIKMPWWLTI